MHRHLPVLAKAVLAMTVTASSFAAAADPALTIYRSDSDELFDAGSQPIANGHAIVHEQRKVQLDGGRQTLVIDGLPALLDTEAVAIDLGDAGRVLAQRVLSAGDAGLLAAHRGERVQVFSRDNSALADGILVAVDNGSLGVRSDDGRISYLRDFARVEFPQGSGMPGSSLQLAIDGKAGASEASLTYPTSGLGWRAAYSALLQDGTDCRLRLDALASIANHSGRDYTGAKLKLVAGAPNFARYDRGPRPVMMMKAAAMDAPESMPEQSALGDYRSYAIDGRLDLPDASVTQVPLYASRMLDCERRWLFETGGSWFPPKPMLASNHTQQEISGPVQSQLAFVADENLPSGTLRVLTRDKDGRTELLGESRIADTAKGRKVDMTLGTAFDLAATRERTAFDIDKAARTLSEGFRIQLRNTGDSARSVTVREHPNRWRGWTLQSSSQKPSTQTPDTLEFTISVPAGGKATLDYRLRYAWLQSDE